MKYEKEITYYKEPKGCRVWEEKNFLFYVNKMVEILESFDYKEVCIPIISNSEIFNEFLEYLYCFDDKSNRRLCITPEYTKKIVLNYKFNKIKGERLFYFLPCCRYEQPQKNRYRNFWQFGVENLNNKKENFLFLFVFFKIFFEKINIKNCVLNINYVGTIEQRYDFFLYLKNKNLICESCNHRPLKIFECVKCDIKIESLHNFIGECRQKDEYKKLTLFLEKLGIDYKFDLQLYRGIDYYQNLIFEIKINQCTIGGGGEYKFCGIEGSGFAIGIDRMVNFLETSYNENIEILSTNPDDIMMLNKIQKYVFSYDKLILFRSPFRFKVIRFVPKNNLKKFIFISHDENRIVFFNLGDEVYSLSLDLKDLKK